MRALRTFFSSLTILALIVSSCGQPEDVSFKETDILTDLSVMGYTEIPEDHESQIFEPFFRPEKRIYLCDVTGSMEGRGVDSTPNIFAEVKERLVSAIDNVDHEDTEIIIVPFTNKVHKDIIGTAASKDSLVAEVRAIKTQSGDTNIADAWAYGTTLLDSTKTNFLFLLTDGLHNCGPEKSVLYDHLRDWANISEGKYSFAFYVMLTSNARDAEIRSIVDTVGQMWNIESMDVDASFVSTSLNIKKNISTDKKIRIDFTSNNAGIFNEDIPFTICMDESPYYEIANYENHFRDRYSTFEIVEKKDREKIPVQTDLQLHVKYDRAEFPLLFFTPEDINISIANVGIRAAAFTETGGYSNGIQFDDIKFREPFRGLLKNKPGILLRSLNWIPFKWCAPDTTSFVKNFHFLVNDECLRSNSSIRFKVTDESGMALPGKLLINGKIANGGIFNITPTTKITDINVEFRADEPGFDFDSACLYATVADLDMLNKIIITQDDILLGQISGQQKLVCNWGVWLLWLLTVLLIAFLIVYLVTELISLVLPIIGVNFLGRGVVRQRQKSATNKSKNKDKKNHSISLNHEQLVIFGDTAYLVAQTIPYGQEIKWFSSDESCISVKGGHLQAKSHGSCVITARLKKFPKVSASCRVKVDWTLLNLVKQFDQESGIAAKKKVVDNIHNYLNTLTTEEAAKAMYQVMSEDMIRLVEDLKPKNLFKRASRFGSIVNGKFMIDMSRANLDTIIPNGNDHSNVNNYTIGQFLEICPKLKEGVKYRNFEPDFTPFAKYVVVLDDAPHFYRHDSEVPKELGKHQSVHERALKKLADMEFSGDVEKARLFKSNNDSGQGQIYIIHERWDCKTILFVQAEVHKLVAHNGGIEIAKKIMSVKHALK